MGLAQILKLDNFLSWGGYKGTLILILSWCEPKWVHGFWRTIWQETSELFLMHEFFAPAISLLGIYPVDIFPKYAKAKCIKWFTLHSIIAKTRMAFKNVS